MSTSSRQNQQKPESAVFEDFGQLSVGESSRSTRSTDQKAFRDGRAARSSDVFIAVMGVTGSGKSSFISLCCERAAEVGHELKACTTVVDVYAYELSASRTVYLIDTPGFDDTNRSDTEVLREIASWLTVSYSNQILLHGIIYLHRIIDVRMQGSAKKNLLMFKKLCGDDALRKVVLATTMWDKVAHHEAEAREQQLVDTPEFWGFMVSKGSTVHRHNNTIESAVQVIEKLAHSDSTVTLDLQNQMVNRNQTLGETAAGRELESAIIKERQKWAAELKDAQEQIQEAIRLRDKESELAMRELKEDYNTRLARLERDNRQLHIDAERLNNERIERLEKALEEQSKTQANKLKELQQKNVELEKASNKIVNIPNVNSESVSNQMRDQWFSAFLNASSLNADRWSLCYGYDNTIGCMTNIDHHVLFNPEHGWTVCGTAGSWVSLKKPGGRDCIAWSENFHVEYPQLHKSLNRRLNVVNIFLGPNKTYFIRWWQGYRTNTRYNYSLPPAIESVIAKISEDGGTPYSVALGISQTYVIVYWTSSRRVRWKWDLKGYYGNLESILKTAISAPELVVLNSYNEDDYLIITDTLKLSLSKNPLGHQDLGRLMEWKDKIKSNLGISIWKNP